MTAIQLTPQDTVERGLALAAAEGADGCVVIVAETSSANLRWANNTLTTNGTMRGSHVTVIATVGAGEGTATGVISRSAVTDDSLAASRSRPRWRRPGPRRRPMTRGRWSTAPRARTGTRSRPRPRSPSTRSSPRRSARPCGRPTSESRWLYGFADHEVVTLYVGSSAGLRVRQALPRGFVSATGKSGDLSQSAWVGAATRDFSDIDPLALDAELTRRLGWASRTVRVDAGRHATVLPPAAVADLTTYLFWQLDGRRRVRGAQCVREAVRRYADRRDAVDEAGAICGQTRICRVWRPSRSRSRGRRAAPRACSTTGSRSRPTDWIRDGKLETLMTEPAHGRRDRRRHGHAGDRQLRAVGGRRDRYDGRPGRRPGERSAADVSVVHPDGRPADVATDRPHPRRRLPGRERRGDGCRQQLPLQREPGRPALPDHARPAPPCRRSPASGATTSPGRRRRRC